METGWHWTMWTMQRVWASGLDAWLLIVGDGGGLAGAVLRAWARGQPRVVQRASDRPGDLLVAADLYLETSPSEAFGLAVVEAGLLGLPVVAFRAPGVSEALGRSWPMVAPGDADAAASELVRLAGDGPARAALGARLRRRMAARFDPARCARRSVELFEAVISRAAVAP
jgi:glycosyltransferase involved in cell wall biosynthesis